MTETTSSASQSGPSSTASIAERMYPNLPKDSAVNAAAAARASQAAPTKTEGAPADRGTQAEPANSNETGSRDTSAAGERTPAQVEQAATQLATDLQLDTADPMSATFAREAVTLGLDKSGAQKLAEMHYQHQSERWEAQREAWRTEAMATASAAEDIPLAQSLLRRFGDEKIGAFLSQGYGDNPAIIGFLARVARAVR